MKKIRGRTTRVSFRTDRATWWRARWLSDSFLGHVASDLVKVSMFVLHRDEIKKTHEILEVTFRKDLVQPEFRGLILGPLGYFYSATMVLANVIIVIPFIYCTVPLISIVMQRAHGADQIQYRSIFLNKYPWDPKSHTPIYVIHYFLESIGAMGAGFIGASVDAGLGYYIFQIAAQFRVLSYRLLHLRSGDDHHSLIRECVNKRRLLMDCCSCLERVYGPIVLWLMVTSAISLCANVYQMSKMDSGSLAIAILYIVTKPVQAFCYAWFGTFLTTETESFRDAIYSSGWPGSGEMSYMTSTIIMLMWRPVALTACQFVTISLDMFIAIINTTVSYFFLLQTIEEGK